MISLENSTEFLRIITGASASDGFYQHASSSSSSTYSSGDYARHCYPGIRGRMSIFLSLRYSCAFLSGQSDQIVIPFGP